MQFNLRQIATTSLFMGTFKISLSVYRKHTFSVFIIGKTIAVLSHFDDDASEIITQIGNILNNFLKSLTQGTMQVGNLTHVDKERTSYLNLFRLRTDIEKMFIEQLIETRVIEIHFFENFLLDMHELEQLLNDTELGIKFHSD